VSGEIVANERWAATPFHPSMTCRLCGTIASGTTAATAALAMAEHEAMCPAPTTTTASQSSPKETS
jgi:hypothetical protein